MVNKEEISCTLGDHALEHDIHTSAIHRISDAQLDVERAAEDPLHET